MKAVYDGEAGLNERRKNLLARVPDSDDWAEFEKDSITTKDLAYLSAATHHEFALLRGKRQDILFHGTEYHCDITDDMLELLKRGKLYFNWIQNKTEKIRNEIDNNYVYNGII